MLHYSLIGASEAAGTVNRMIEDIRAFGHEHMPQELTAWQAEDMHRHFPRTETPNYVTAETYIWPRSRTWRRKDRQHRPRYVARVHQGVIRQGGKHPILRPELFEKLQERMARLMREKLTWKPGAPRPQGQSAAAQRRRFMYQRSNLNI